MVYGIASFPLGFLPFLFYCIFNNYYDVLPLELSIYAHFFAWASVGVTFLLNQFVFDDDFFRKLFKYSVIISIAGVYVGYWVGLAF